ncbi:MAG TPA: preprotein translocase subunit SecA, partial [Clostridia bacterium]|nr:preprotein translocase subunit SecA [Clostridia bacterium]
EAYTIADYSVLKKITDKKKEQVKALGGLRIVGTCRNDSRRIDDQLRGRSGRQGDPGSSVFYLSMEDDMLRVFGGETMQNIAAKLNVDEDQVIELSMLTKQIEHAQARIEGRDFSIRKSVLAYDDVMNVQRNLIYEQRNKVLDGLDMSNQIEKMIIEQVEIICNNYIDMTVGYKSWDYEGFNIALEQKVLADGTNLITEEFCSVYNAIKIRDGILDEVFRQYDAKVADATENGIDFHEV